MANRWKRYGEARLYLAGGSVGFLVLLWSAMFAHDKAQIAETASQPASSAVSQSQNRVAAPTQAPQTRTRGS